MSACHEIYIIRGKFAKVSDPVHGSLRSLYIHAEVTELREEVVTECCAIVKHEQ